VASQHRKSGLELTAFYNEGAEYFHALLSGKRDHARRLRHRLIRKLNGVVSTADATPKHWLLLADIYARLDPIERCIRQALRLAHDDAEAHAELAHVLARRGKANEVRRHVELALRYCKRGDPVEEVILHTVADAAAMVHQEDLARNARRRGRRRFPESVLFQP
jgi:cytochrome c-type biogenesis protein CcmH/NrfG